MSVLDLIRLAELTQKFQGVERRIYVAGVGRKENDVEHSFQLAFLAWYIADRENLSLNTDLLTKYALIHDLVEVHAGDTYAFTTNKKERGSKEHREKEAAKQLKKEYPEFEELHKLIEQYEKKKDEESRFIYALDKVLPVINNYLDRGYQWRKDGVTLEMIIEYKKDKVSASPFVKKYFDELLGILEKDHDKLFAKKQKKT